MKKVLRFILYYKLKKKMMDTIVNEHCQKQNLQYSFSNLRNATLGIPKYKF